MSYGNHFYFYHVFEVDLISFQFTLIEKDFRAIPHIEFALELMSSISPTSYTNFEIEFDFAILRLTDDAAVLEEAATENLTPHHVFVVLVHLQRTWLEVYSQ